MGHALTADWTDAKNALPARYDLPWKTVITHAFHPLMDFYFPDLSARIDWRQRWKPRRIIILFNAMNWMMTLPEPRQRRFWQTILRLEKEHEMKLLNPLEQMFFDDGIKKGLEQGRREGRQEGRQEGLEQGLELGRTEGAAALLERQLERRFGPLPRTARNKLAKASVAEVELWSDALLTAQSLRQVFGAPR